MIETTLKETGLMEYIYGAIFNFRMPGFKDDYSILHSLIRKYHPKRIFEFGCNTGFGTKIICNAAGKECEVFSFDLPIAESDSSLQHPINKGCAVGEECNLPFTLILGNSYTYDFSKLGNFDFAYVDSEHIYAVVLIEAKAAINMNAKVICFHDVDVPEVYNAIVDAFEGNEDYELTRVVDTRILFAIKK